MLPDDLESKETFRSNEERENFLLAVIRLLSSHFSLAEANSQFRATSTYSSTSSSSSCPINGSPPIPLEVKTILEKTLYR